jgi:5'-methylthioadenosine phosphorylase
MDVRPTVGIIGGSGLYSLLDGGSEVELRTPYGPPSDVLTVGSLAGTDVAFLPRHGRDHRHSPHRINYRANLWALRMLGVRQVIAPCAVGSLRPDLRPGVFVIPDQVVDRTSGREGTFFDRGAVHVGFADPYCPVGRAVAAKGAADLGIRVAEGGTMVVINGPRYSSRAESLWHAAQGWSVVNMTGQPEAQLARELALCYSSIALVTDMDAGAADVAPVTHAQVLAEFEKNIRHLRELLLAVVPALPVERSCPCSAVHDGVVLPVDLP